MLNQASPSELSYFEYQDDLDHNENLEIASVSEVYKDAMNVVKKRFNDREERVLNQLTLRSLKKKPKAEQERPNLEDDMANDESRDEEYQEELGLEFSGLKPTDLIIQEYDQVDGSNVDMQEFHKFVQQFSSSIGGSESNIGVHFNQQAMQKQELLLGTNQHTNKFRSYETSKINTGQNSIKKIESQNFANAKKQPVDGQQELEKYKLFSCSSSEEQSLHLRARLKSGITE